LADTLYTGQSEGLFLLALAVAWQHRDSWAGGVAVGALIAAKLVAWPLVLWLVFTRRWRASAIAVLAAVGLLAASWAPIDFNGLLQYPHLLSADAHAFEDWSNSFSFVWLGMHLGASRGAATAIAVIAGSGGGLLIALWARGSDQGWFSAAVMVGLLISPLLWTHYLVVLFAPLAVGRRRAIVPWLWTVSFWIVLLSPTHLLAWLVMVAGSAVLAGWATSARHVSAIGRTASPAPAN
jgi:hypothetical protein